MNPSSTGSIRVITNKSEAGRLLRRIAPLQRRTGVIGIARVRLGNRLSFLKSRAGKVNLRFHGSIILPDSEHSQGIRSSEAHNPKLETSQKLKEQNSNGTICRPGHALPNIYSNDLASRCPAEKCLSRDSSSFAKRLFKEGFSPFPCCDCTLRGTNLGAKLPRSTMCEWIAACGLLLTRIPRVYSGPPTWEAILPVGWPALVPA